MSTELGDDRLLVALDVERGEQALELAEALRGVVGGEAEALAHDAPHRTAHELEFEAGNDDWQRHDRTAHHDQRIGGSRAGRGAQAGEADKSMQLPAARHSSMNAARAMSMTGDTPVRL